MTYEPPNSLAQLCDILDQLPSQSEADQNHHLQVLFQDIKPLFAVIRRAAFIRTTLREGPRRANQILGVSRRNLNKTCSEARSELQHALRLLGGGADPDLLAVGAPFGPVARTLVAELKQDRSLAPSNGSKLDTLEPGNRRQVLLAGELARLILEGNHT